LRCWACRHPFIAAEIRRDGIIRGRKLQDGGPWRNYRCHRCQRWCCAEELPDGGIYISPEKDIGILDYLFGWIEPLAPDDFLLLLRWNQDHAGERRQIFETRRDYRYSGGRLARAIRRLFGGRHRRHVPDGQQPGSDRKESSTPGKSSAREGTIPHPYLVLGISIDASGEEVRAAFKDLVRKYHPDKQHGAGAESMESATRRLKELIKAYEELEGQT